jgi:K(+)-stimulated pyrophosphate-energized sodium pump
MLGVDGRTLLMSGLVVSGLGVAFAIAIYVQMKNMPVHKAMLEISELIFETCKTYVETQVRFIMVLFGFIGTIMAVYYGVFVGFPITKVIVILVFSLVGIDRKSVV